MSTILLVDDDPQGRQSTQRILEAEGHSVLLAGDGQEALALVRHAADGGIDAILTDIRMPRMDGLEFFKALSVLSSPIPVILMTAFGRLDEAVWAMKLGAVDFLSKPFKRRQLIDALVAALARGAQARGRAILQADAEGPVSASPGMSMLRQQLKQVAATSATVLVKGESGVGKERVAREIHSLGHRASGPFVAINCAAIPEQLLESELFGHEKGAFTGAVQAKAGLFEAAAGGTLLLDEIGDMPLALQAKLLRVLQEGEVRRLGSVRSATVDVRIIAATHQDLHARVAEGRFRQDLLYRLEVVVLTIPPLRERREDIPGLVAHFFAQARLRHGKPHVASWSPEAMDALMAYPWPGNVRELSNAVERAVILCQDTVAGLADLPQSVGLQDALKGGAGGGQQPGKAISIPFGTALKDVEDLLIRRTLEATEGDKELAAHLLGITSRTIYRKLGHKEGGHA